MNVGGGAISGYTAEDTNLIDGPKGFTYRTDTPVIVPSGTNNADIYLTERFTKANALTYKIPVTKAGVYTVKTLHSESYLTNSKARAFKVEINGKVTNANVEIFDAVGQEQGPDTDEHCFDDYCRRRHNQVHQGETEPAGERHIRRCLRR